MTHDTQAVFTSSPNNIEGFEAEKFGRLTQSTMRFILTLVLTINFMRWGRNGDHLIGFSCLARSQVTPNLIVDDFMRNF